MILPHRVPIRPTAPPSSLEILAADQTTVDVDVGHRLGAETFKVEFQVLAGDLQIRG